MTTSFSLKLEDLKFPIELDDVLSQNTRLRRHNDFLRRKYLHAQNLLEEARDASGYYSHPFPFLLLPREIRNRIYVYALTAPVAVRSHPLPVNSMSVFKPPTPGLVLVNRRLHREGTEIMYSGNKFTFDEPKDMLEFLAQIGERNKTFIQSISFSVDCNVKIPRRAGYSNLDMGTESSYWENALAQTGFDDLVRMEVLANYVDGGPCRCVIDPGLVDAIEHVLGGVPRRKKSQDRFGVNAVVVRRRKLNLVGFGNEWKKFPSQWEIWARQWGESEAEEELEEELNSQYDDYGEDYPCSPSGTAADKPACLSDG